ncbi:DUF1501 domain-containing protein [Geothrix sp. PMB-07]|uniref:DUF1501 domain-containing protein n=1 Tax=Geothrix sp. PMB-07 TaxID=3068640 RepID=UPI0027408452|nr:DUF1501 domain-containing protein [Geothrix sp. PMB-07]WLT31902.1 DUF1501 domain-containing protein [Geothrix sp. PMB-07]
MQRRQFLLGLASTGLALKGMQLFAAPAASPKVLVIFLRGGYDCANVLVPYASSFYYEARPTLALAKPDAADAQSCAALDGTWGLHPALKDSILPLWKQGQVAFVPFAGTHDTSRSHFETQDSIEGGEPLDGPKEYGSGFLNRLAEVLGNANPIAFTDGLPLAMKGSLSVPNVSLKQVGKAAFDDRQMALLAEMYQGHPLEASVVEGLQLRKEVAQDFAREQNEANRSAISPKGFELEARRMGRMLRDRFGLGFLDIGGWDTHTNEAAILNGNLGNLGKGLAAFAEEMGSAWARTTVVVISEFGRTFRENGTRGTDHGHGSVAWILGGGVKGKRVAGEQIAIERKTLFQDRDYPVLNEYRALMGGLFRRIYGLSEAQANQVFPRVKTRDLELV